MTMPKVTLNYLINQYVKTLNGEPFIVSVSGGMDSMTLLHLTKHFKPHVVHFNHQVRTESDLDLELVKTFCKKYELSYDIFHLNVPKSNFQHEAHKLRKQKLSFVANNRNIKHVFTAHHADDQTETIFMRLIRGSDISGYTGLHLQDTMDFITYHKPLLNVSKSDIEIYVKTYKVPYLDDHTNISNDYFRNRIRNQVIPTLKKENPKLNEAIQRFHEQLLANVEHVNQDVTTKPIKPTRDAFNTYSKAIKTQLLIQFMREHNIDYTYDQLRLIIELIASKKPNAEIHLSNDNQFIISYQSFFIQKKHTHSNMSLVLQEGLNVFDQKQISIFFDNNNTFKDSTFKICYNKDALPLIVRHRKDGDLLSFHFGHKKLKSYFIDKKIPKHLRDELLVIADQNQHILWVENTYVNATIQSENKVGITLKGDNHASRHSRHSLI